MSAFIHVLRNMSAFIHVLSQYAPDGLGSGAEPHALWMHPDCSADVDCRIQSSHNAGLIVGKTSCGQLKVDRFSGQNPPSIFRVIERYK
jgi:hypothetical protein